MSKLSKMNFILLIVLFVVDKILTQQQQQFLNVCQSGIREDNTNYIYCARRGLTEVPIFSKNNVVYDELVLADNKIQQLTVASFNRIKVKKIFLNGNPIRSIEPLTFQKLENHLEELWLDASESNANEQSLVGLPKAIVYYLRNLNTLRLKGLYVKTLENFSLKKLNRIEVLSLQFCSIEKIEPNAFDGLHNSLKELYLDGNQLQFIPTDALVNGAFKSLKVLSLSQNNIKSISYDSFGLLSGLNHLQKLDLSYNGLKVIDSQSFNWFNNSLETLLLQNNELNSYNLKFIRQLTSLKELNLDFNLITKLGQNSFSNSHKLQFLSMQGNTINFEQTEDLEEDGSSYFVGLDGLQRLNLARNGIKMLPNRLFAPMKQLKSLIMDKNPLENLNELSFDGLFQTLMNISIQNTKFKSKYLLSLKHMERLERVKLGFNDLNTIEWSTFDKTSQTLSNLDLQNNKINELNFDDNNFIKMENLVELDLSNNKLCNVGVSLLERLPKLKNLGLSQNPLYCDCNLLPLYEWTRSKFDRDMLSYTQWQCELPVKDEFDYAKTVRRKFTQLNQNDFQCSNTTESKCIIKQQQQPRPNQISIKMTQSPLRSAISTSFMSSTLAKDYFFEPTSAPISNNKLARISNLKLTNYLNSIQIDWELDIENNDLSDIKGFKISFSQSNDNKTNSFLTDKYQRSFKLDNLVHNAHYTCCVSILRMQGYDKYCKEIDLNNNNEFARKTTKKQQQIKLLNGNNSTRSQLIVSPLSINEPIQTSSNLANSNVLSGLMITVLVILICFIIALLVFIYIYIRKCNQNKKLLKSAKSINNSGSMTLNSRRNYSGGILSASTINRNPHHHLHLEQAILNNHPNIMNCYNYMDPIVGNNCIKLACGSSVNPINVQNAETNSTVSSTLSSVANTSNQNETNHNVLTISPDNANQNNMNNKLLNNDLLASSPSSFTHFKPGTGYMPYDIYNGNNNTSTLILPIQQNQNILKQAYLTLANNNNNSNLNSKYGFITTTDGNDHVYCEIPSSTIGRSFNNNRQQLQQILVYSADGQQNLRFLNTYDQMIMINNLESANSNINNVNNLNNNSNQQQRYNSQQNSSASLLLSTTSSSSNSTTPSISSPKNNLVNVNSAGNNNKLTASII